jgi:hypothetical protein
VRNALAFAVVVVILLCRMSDVAMFASIDFLCELVLPRWLITLECRISLYP